MKIAIQRVGSKDRNIPLPSYMTESASGMDIYSACAEEIFLQPGDRALVPTGFAIALPQGFEAQIRPRSGLALNHGVTCLNTPGTIDADYRGEVKVLLINLGKEPFCIRFGERIAQMVIQRVERAVWVESEALPKTERESGGFGSTGQN